MAYQLQKTINGSEIRHLQFSEFSEGHGSIYGTLEDGSKFKLHITELMKMMDEFNFSVYPGPGDVLDHQLNIDWKSTNKLRDEKDFTFKSETADYVKMGNLPNKVNYVYKTGKGKNTNFIQKRTGPYYSGNLVITNPGDVKEI